LRLFSVGSVYRYDEPQKGRYREFWQSNFELIGSSKPEADAEIIILTDSLMKTVGLKSYAFKIGHVGVLRGILSREKLDEKKQNEIMQLMDHLQFDDAIKVVQDAGTPEKCVKVLRELVNLKGDKVFEIADRIKECTKEYERAAAAAENLHEILKLVAESGCRTHVTVDAGFARGLEYYTGIIFEVNAPELDIALGGGGRYDRLVELFGGDLTPAVGVAHGLDRIMLAMQDQKVTWKTNVAKRVLIVPIGESLKIDVLRIAQTLRNAGIVVEVEVMGRKMAKALEDADRRGMDFAVIIGEQELKEGAVVVRNLRKREQSTVMIDKVLETLLA
jgi:histidyl-tRNA synthetase